MAAAFSWGALGAAALLIGSILASHLRPTRNVIAVVMAIGTSDADLVPLGHRFDVVWRGYHRRQVNEYVDLALGWLTAAATPR